jgi:hypothetical protein
MNNRFRKKPIVVEAFQMTKSVRGVPDAWPEWLVRAKELSRETLGSLFITYPFSIESTFSIYTLDGLSVVNWDDWIIRGFADEIYLCKPEIFTATYEKVR